MVASLHCGWSTQVIVRAKDGSKWRLVAIASITHAFPPKVAHPAWCHATPWPLSHRLSDAAATAVLYMFRGKCQENNFISLLVSYVMGPRLNTDKKCFAARRPVRHTSFNWNRSEQNQKVFPVDENCNRTILHSYFYFSLATLHLTCVPRVSSFLPFRQNNPWIALPTWWSDTHILINAQAYYWMA